MAAQSEVTRQELVTSTRSESGKPCKPYPFYRYHDKCTYPEMGILDVTESGALDYIEPCHEFKAFIHTSSENEMEKVTREVICFAAACMNSRTNGTIHFGVGDLPRFPHGQVLGVIIRDKEAFQNTIQAAIDSHFEHKHIPAARSCIKHARFVRVVNQDMAPSEKYVIEVDIVPDSVTCKDNTYHVFSVKNKGKKSMKKQAEGTESKPSKQFFIREGSSCKDLALPAHAETLMQYERFFPDLLKLRKKAEEKSLTKVKSSSQGSRLSQMITGGSASLDKSHFERYLIVTNESHPIQLESLAFLQELNPTAVLDFGPQENGLYKQFEEKCTVTVHSPKQYKITEAVEVIAGKLELTRRTSWVFCNRDVHDENPSDAKNWLKDKGASVRDVISFLCRSDVLPNKRFLVIFLLLSTVSERMDPLLETFIMFWQELQGTQQILCICENEKAFTHWKDLIESRLDVDISDRCIYELSFSEVNGTILSLLSENRRASRFLPCGGGSRVLLEKKVEMSLDTLDILCVNQCEGGSEDKAIIEENFYRGGTVSWWNFYFCEEPGSIPFIKRDRFDFIINTIIPDLCLLTKACVSFNLMHVPGCGGTTLAKHILWNSKERFRCAVLENRKPDLAKVAEHVVQLLMHDHKVVFPRIPVLLMIDDFEDMENVHQLQQLIEDECVKKDIQSKSPQVILLNCMKSESTEPTTLDEELGVSIFLGNKLSEKEQRLFSIKLKEIERTHKNNSETFYGFMIMKSNFLPEYIEGVARNTLKSFNFREKHAQLIAILALLNTYCKCAPLSVSLCEEYLDFHPTPYCGSTSIEDRFRKFSTLITRVEVKGKVLFTALKMIHSTIAHHCLQELTTTHNVTKIQITDLLLTTDKFFEYTQGKHTLLQDVRFMLLKRNPSDKDGWVFSPLINSIAKESQGSIESVLLNASKRYASDSGVLQLLARYYYLKEKDFQKAKNWASKAKELSRESSYIADTSAQVVKHELKNALEKHGKNVIESTELKRLLTLAQSATEKFQEVNDLAKREGRRSFHTRMDRYDFNTAGCHGEIEVAELVLQILKKTPMFSTDNGYHYMRAVLSGITNIQNVKTSEYIMYYSLLEQFHGLLFNIKDKMKVNFDFLENFYVNLRFGNRQNKEERTKEKLLRLYEKYTDFFCQQGSKDHLVNEGLTISDYVCHKRQYLEKQKADTHSGILNCLLLPFSSEVIEEIARAYDFILQNAPDLTLKEKINSIYINVVLCCNRSNIYKDYAQVVELLCQILDEVIPLSENMPVYFIAIGLLWPQTKSDRRHQPAKCKQLGQFVSQLKNTYHTVMKEVCHGKKPFVHFYLGKGQGYRQLIHCREIEEICCAGEGSISTLWENGTIWKNKTVHKILCRVKGYVSNGRLVAYTSLPHLEIEVIPMFRCQISGQASGSKVSFFIGFSMKGPMAFDIG